MTGAGPYRVYGDSRSGNCMKVRWMLELSGRDYEWHAVDILNGGTRTEAFLALNPNGRVPVLQRADGSCLAESNAILYYLADGTPWLPSATFERARVLQWQCFEQYSHEPYIAVARFIRVYLGLPASRRAEYESKLPGGYEALAVMERHLARERWFVGATPTIADISLYAYTHVADEAGFDLAAYPAVRAWLARMAEALPQIDA